MTVRELNNRIVMARIMNKLEEMNKNDSDKVKKDSNGTYHYYDSNGNELITAKMERKAD